MLLLGFSGQSTAPSWYEMTLAARKSPGPSFESMTQNMSYKQGSSTSRMRDSYDDMSDDVYGNPNSGMLRLIDCRDFSDHTTDEMGYRQIIGYTCAE